MGSFASYAEARRAVGYLAERKFPVNDLTIVGVDLMQVERVLGRFGRRQMLGERLATALGLGCFTIALLAYAERASAAQAVGMIGGVVLAVVVTSVGYVVWRRRRDVTSSTQLVAGRYDVLSHPRTAEWANKTLARYRSTGLPARSCPLSPGCGE